MKRTINKISATIASGAFALYALAAAVFPETVLPSELVPWMNAMVQVESNNRPWAVLNNTYYRSGVKPAGHFFNSRAEAEDYAKKHIALGHNLDLGLYQNNWKYAQNRPGVNIDNIFDPWVQAQIGKMNLLEFYNKAKRTYGAGELAIRRAVSAYNNGNIFSDNGPYLSKVYKQLGKSTAGLNTAGGRSSSAAEQGGNPSTGTGSTPPGSEVAGAGVSGKPKTTAEIQAQSKPGEITSQRGAIQTKAPAEIELEQAQALEQEQREKQGEEGLSALEILVLIVALIIAAILIIKLAPLLIKGAATGAKKAAMRAAKSVYGAVKKGTQNAEGHMG